MEERSTTTSIDREALESLANKVINKYIRRLILPCYEVTISPPGLRRTNDQNRFYHYLIEGICKHTGMTKSEVIKEMKRRFLEVDVPTSKLNNVEMGAYIQAIHNFAVNEGNGTYGPELIDKCKKYREGL